MNIPASIELSKPKIAALIAVAIVVVALIARKKVRIP